VFRIRLSFNADPDPAFFLNADPDPVPDPDPGFFDTLDRENLFFKLSSKFFFNFFPFLKTFYGIKQRLCCFN